MRVRVRVRVRVRMRVRVRARARARVTCEASTTSRAPSHAWIERLTWRRHRGEIGERSRRDRGDLGEMSSALTPPDRAAQLVRGRGSARIGFGRTS